LLDEVLSALFAVFVIVTFASATTAPVASFTTPATVPVSACPNTNTLVRSTTASIAIVRHKPWLFSLLITGLLNFNFFSISFRLRILIPEAGKSENHAALENRFPTLVEPNCHGDTQEPVSGLKQAGNQRKE
jgi:hypothetical protein